MINKKFGLLTIIGTSDERRGGHVMVLCRCDCGNEKLIRLGHVTRGITVSCGCIQKQATSEYSKTHGMSQDKTYHIWHAMMQRCYNKNNHAYSRYGGRGIYVCDAWHKFENFVKDMGICPQKLTIDRIDNNKGYFKENCRWASYHTQARNRHNNTLITFKGQTLTIADWSDKTGIHQGTINKRLRLGWPIEDVLCKPIREHRPYRKSIS